MSFCPCHSFTRSPGIKSPGHDYTVDDSKTGKLKNVKNRQHDLLWKDCETHHAAQSDKTLRILPEAMVSRKNHSFISSLTVDINNESNKLLCFISSPSAIQRYCKGEKTKNNNKINGELKSLKQWPYQTKQDVSIFHFIFKNHIKLQRVPKRQLIR